MNYIFVLTILFISLSFQAQETYTIADIPLELYKNANSVILNDEIIVDVTDESKMRYKFNRAIVVLNKKGRNKVGAKFHYNDDSKITKFEAYIYDKNGEELAHYKKRDLIDISAVSGGTIYSDSRKMYLDYTPTTYPYIVVYNYEKESNSSAFIPEWYPINGFYESTKGSTFTILFNKNNKPRVKEFNIDEDRIVKTETPTQITYKATNFEAVKYERLSQHYSSILPNVDFALNKFYLKGEAGYAENWKEFGKWRYDKLVHGLDEVPKMTALKINEIVLGAKSDREKTKRIYEYVQNKTRYISVQLGIGGWKPYPASDVDKLGYGDCKGLTNYTKALLKTQGIESYYSVVWAGPEKRSVHNEFASMQGNHVILNVPLEGEEVWLECTSQEIPFGFLGTFTDDRDVLVITPEGGEIKHTTVYNFDTNLLTTKGYFYIKPDGSIDAEVEMESYNIQYYQRFRLESDDNDTQEKFYKEYWNYIANIKIDSIVLKNEPEIVKFTEKVNFSARSFSIFVGEDMIVNVNAFNRSSYLPERVKDRKNKLKILRGFVDVDNVIIKLPIGYFLNELPEAIVIESDFGTYKSSLERISEFEIKYHREFKIYGGVYEKEAYTNYRDFRKKVTRADKQKIVLSK